MDLDRSKRRPAMFDMFARLLERQKEAQRASIEELASWLPAAAEGLWQMHRDFSDRLDERLADARRLVDEQYPVGEEHDPAWLLLGFLRANCGENDCRYDGINMDLYWEIATFLPCPND